MNKHTTKTKYESQSHKTHIDRDSEIEKTKYESQSHKTHIDIDFEIKTLAP
jgi:hypothetical protein